MQEVEEEAVEVRLARAPQIVLAGILVLMAAHWEDLAPEDLATHLERFSGHCVANTGTQTVSMMQRC